MTPTDGARRAAAAVVQAPLRWHEGESGRDPAEVSRQGWFLGASECARHLARLAESPITTARAFGGEWPVIRGGGGWLVAPALPLALSGSGGDGIDAAYGLREDAVWREATGAEEIFLVTADTGLNPGRAFDLLWFGDGERYTVRRGVLEVEDLFALLELPLDQQWLERILIRGRRVSPQVLDGLTFPEHLAPARMTVRRAVALSKEGSWRDPERFLVARTDVERTTTGSDGIEILRVGGETAKFQCREHAEGWGLYLDDGEYPLTQVSLDRRQHTLSLAADIHPAVDPLAQGMRGRLAFDLRSDLVALE